MDIKVAFNTFLQVIYKLLAGLLSVVAFFLIGTVLIAYGLNLGLNNYVLILLGGLAIFMLFYIWKNYDQISENDNKNSSFLLVKEIIKLSTVIIIFFVIAILANKNPKIINYDDLEESNEMVTLMVDTSKVTAQKYYISNQTWKDFSGEKHRLPFRVNYDAVLKSYKNRQDFFVDYKYTWGALYKNLADNDRSLIEELSQTFFTYQQERKMNRREFAELIISAIQDIPYTLILNTACEEGNVKPCIGNVKMGVFAPAEFISSLYGDCDTRTVILFTLLSRFNYDVAILNSKKYSHSVLGINIPSTGKYKEYHQKKYYFIEATGRGAPIGYLHSDFSNINYWKFELINEQKI